MFFLNVETWDLNVFLKGNYLCQQITSTVYFDNTQFEDSFQNKSHNSIFWQKSTVSKIPAAFSNIHEGKWKQKTVQKHQRKT